MDDKTELAIKNAEGLFGSPVHDDRYIYAPRESINAMARECMTDREYNKLMKQLDESD